MLFGFLLLGCSKVYKPIAKDCYNNPPKNYKSILDFGANGEDEKSDTENIQKAIDSGADKIYFPKGVYYIDAAKPHPITKKNTFGGIIFSSGLNILLHNEAIVRAIPTDSKNYCIFNIYNCNNVTIRGGQIIGERKLHKGDEGEWGMGILIVGAHNIKITDVTIKDCWGDGVYIAESSGRWSENIVMNRVLCDNNRRNGVSIVCGRNIYLKNSSFLNTNGTPPMAGVDIEPNNGKFYAEDIKFKNCVFNNNKYVGLKIVGRYGSVNGVRVKNATIKNNGLVNLDLLDTIRNVRLDNIITDDPSSAINYTVYGKKVKFNGFIKTRKNRIRKAKCDHND